MTLDGFRSRWTTPRVWAYAIVWQTCSKTERNRGRSSAGSRRASQQRGQGPAPDQLHGDVTAGRRGSRPSSWTGTIPGCWSWPPIWASSTNRRTISGWSRCSLQEDLHGQVAAEVDVAAQEHHAHARRGRSRRGAGSGPARRRGRASPRSAAGPASPARGRSVAEQDAGDRADGPVQAGQDARGGRTARAVPSPPRHATSGGGAGPQARRARAANRASRLRPSRQRGQSPAGPSSG